MAVRAPVSLRPSTKKIRARRVLVSGATMLMVEKSLNLSLAWSRDRYKVGKKLNRIWIEKMISKKGLSKWSSL